MEEDFTAVGFGELLLELIGRHIVLASAVNQNRALRAQALRLSDGVNRGIAAADDGNAVSHLHLMQGLRMDALDKVQRVENLMQVLTGDIHPRAAPKTDPDEDRVIFFFELSGR